MEKVILAAILIFSPLLVLAGEEWKDTYANEIEPQAKKEVEKEQRNQQCSIDLPLLRKKLTENPDSEFLKFKVEELSKICR